jgi:hypothetical protein
MADRHHNRTTVTDDFAYWRLQLLKGDVPKDVKTPVTGMTIVGANQCMKRHLAVQSGAEQKKPRRLSGAKLSRHYQIKHNFGTITWEMVSWHLRNIEKAFQIVYARKGKMPKDRENKENANPNNV